MKRRGFTLIEVLVVMAVIALLSAIIIPVLQRSKKQASGLVCTSNLRQLSLGVSVYLQDNKSYPYGFYDIPGYSNKSVNSVKDWPSGWWWFDFLKEEIVGDVLNPHGLLWCPSRRFTASGTPDYGNVFCGNYGVNYAIFKITTNSTPEFSGIPLRPEQIRSPSSKLLVMDSGYMLISRKALMPDGAGYPFENAGRQNVYYLPGLESNQSRDILPAQREDAVNGRHDSGRFNAAFADGHVDKRSPSSVVPELDAEGNSSKNSPWSP